MKRFVLGILVLIFLCSCSAHPSRVSKKISKKLTYKLTYIMDSNTGLCYAVISSRIRWAGIIPLQQNGLGLTQVPCNACRDQIKGK